MTRLLSTTLIVLGFLATVEPAGAIKQFIVFFAAGDSERLDPVQWQVGPEGEAVIREAAAVYDNYGPGGRIVLAAGDQRVGTLEMSVERSRKRADAVRDLLVKYGVPRASVLTKPCGFELYLTETPPGVKEPMNRFVMMDLVAPDAVVVDGSRDGCAR